MSKLIYNQHLIGRFGNQLFQYAWAKKRALLDGAELRTNYWPGKRIFTGVTENPIIPGEGMDLPRDAYHQTQADLIYTRREVRRWFEWKAWVHNALRGLIGAHSVVAHLRRGDYATCGYVMVSEQSYRRLAPHCFIVSDERRAFHEDFQGDLAFVPDFYLMQYAPVLLRANSTFSWWAATLGIGRVFAPIIEGREAGICDCDFVEGNWPRFVVTPAVTDLYLNE